MKRLYDGREAARSHAAAEHAMKVLIIDDDPEIRLLAVAFLARRGGMAVFEAGSGEEGLEIAERELPDVILLDAVMAGMDGVATLAALRSREKTASIPVIFLTGLSAADERARLEQLGVHGVLAKPFSPSTLASTVRDLIASPGETRSTRD
jgi:two-component system alkaline phosphatase synthesis response regulator PhoP